VPEGRAVSAPPRREAPKVVGIQTQPEGWKESSGASSLSRLQTYRYASTCFQIYPVQCCPNQGTSSWPYKQPPTPPYRNQLCQVKYAEEAYADASKWR